MIPPLRAARSPSRLVKLAPCIIAAIVMSVLWLVRYPFPVGIAQDDGMYMILAKALATGRGFRTINLPGAPAGVHFPPGYPLLLAALWKLAPNFPANTVIFALANIVLLGVAAAGLFVLCRRLGLTAPYAATCTLAGFLMPPALWMGTALLSEPLWLALTIWCLVWIESAIQRPRSIRWSTAIAIGLSAGLIALVRTQAAALVFGIVVVLAIRKEWKLVALTVLGALLALGPWQIWVARHAAGIPAAVAGKYGPYATWLLDGLRDRGPALILTAFVHNVASSADIVGAMFGPPGASWIGVILLAGPAVAGARRLARCAPVLFVMLLAHTAIIILLPWEPRRYIWTSWPFLTLWIGAGFVELAAMLAQRSARMSETGPSPGWRVARAAIAVDGTLLGIAAAALTGIMLWTGAYRAIAAGQARRIVPAVAWVQQHASREAVVASDDETAIYLYTGRLSVPASTFNAAAYGRNIDPSAGVFDAVIAHYHPELAVVSWNTTVDAAMRLSSGVHPVLRPVARIDLGVIFERTNAAGVDSERGTANTASRGERSSFSTPPVAVGVMIR